MDNPDCVLNIALHSNYKLALKFIQTCKYFSTNLWKLKCKYHFPQKPYFDFWTGRENYLVQIRKFFTLVYYFTPEDTFVDKSIYEYDRMLPHIVNIFIDEEYGSLIKIFIKFTIQAQFVVIRDYNSRDVSLVGQFSTKEEALEFIMSDKLKYCDSDPFFAYTIVDLQYIVPYFMKLGKFRDICVGQHISVYHKVDL